MQTPGHLVAMVHGQQQRFLFGAARQHHPTCARRRRRPNRRVREPALLQRLAQSVGFDVRARRDLHDVLVAHELVGMLADHRQRRLGRPGTAFG